ncbi:hypothetical protein CK203_106423 [Vitis vinifera]|uniref:Integrase catalytic domain-containing protein n=1 Tax=Vitis vinifera TaxID=29760 RepID=A0A438DGR5_VITVI|nr:hypothetical protein CK203_106423 [Vitis vinifera]
MYNAPANGLAETFNKTLCNLLKKIVDKSKRDWHERIPSLRIVIHEGLTDEDNAKLRLQELEALDEKQLEAQQCLECYQARLLRVFNKQVRLRSFQVGDLVLAICRPIITTHKTKSKFTSKWDGPCVVQEVYTNGAYKIIVEDRLRIGPINGNS